GQCRIVRGDSSPWPLVRLRLILSYAVEISNGCSFNRSTFPKAGTRYAATISAYRSMVRGATWGLMWASHFSRKVATVSRDGSTELPVFSSVSSRAHSTCASRFVPVKECQRRLRLPVDGSRTSSTMAQCPDDRSRICPFINVPPFEYMPGHVLRPTQVDRKSAGIDTNLLT